MTGEDLSHLAGGEIIPDAPSMAEIADMAGGFLKLVALSQDIPADFDGCAMHIQIDQKTRRLISVVLSLLDLQDENLVAREDQMRHDIGTAKVKND